MPKVPVNQTGSPALLCLRKPHLEQGQEVGDPHCGQKANQQRLGPQQSGWRQWQKQIWDEGHSGSVTPCKLLMMKLTSLRQMNGLPLQLPACLPEFLPQRCSSPPCFIERKLSVLPSVKQSCEASNSPQGIRMFAAFSLMAPTTLQLRSAKNNEVMVPSADYRSVRMWVVVFFSPPPLCPVPFLSAYNKTSFVWEEFQKINALFY